MTDRQLQIKFNKAFKLAFELSETLHRIADEYDQRGDEQRCDWARSKALDAGECWSYAEYQGKQLNNITL